MNWSDTQKYVRWLSEETGRLYRLLSEAEWEYAARAGAAGPFHFGSAISTDQANYDGTYTYGVGRKGVSRRKTVPVGSFPANRFGLHDVHGNVREWVEDCRHADYRGAPADGSAWTSGGDCENRTLRGGAWHNFPRHLRSASRLRTTAGIRNNAIGFRVARTLAPASRGAGEPRLPESAGSQTPAKPVPAEKPPTKVTPSPGALKEGLAGAAAAAGGLVTGIGKALEKVFGPRGQASSADQEDEVWTP